MTDDDYVAEFARKHRRRAGLRLVTVGALVAAIGGSLLVYSVSWTAESPGLLRVVITAQVTLAIGALVLLPGLFMLAYSRRPAAKLPVAKLRV